MIKKIRTLIKLIRESKKLAKEAREVVGNYIQQHSPELSDGYTRWFGQKRTIDAVLITGFCGESLCILEKDIFNQYRKSVGFFAGAIGRISDDLLDEGMDDCYEAMLFAKNNPIKNSHINLRLLRSLEGGLLHLLPTGFLENFGNIISKYNQAQFDSLRLYYKLNPKEIIDIKDRTGGYSALLLYSFFFPEKVDLSVNFSGNYKPNSSLPTTKTGAIYNWGAWLSRLDDLWDAKKDKEKGVKQLVSEGLVDWRSFKQESVYVFNGFKKFYSEESVEDVKRSFELLSNKSLERFF